MRRLFSGEQVAQLQCLPIAPLACGKAAFTPAIRLGVLLSSAAALPISRWYSLISVYRSTHQCGERGNAAFRRQSAANLTSLAPHVVRRGCKSVTNCRDSWRSHVHRTYIAQRVQFFKIETANVWGRGGRPLVLSLGGLRGILSFEKESIPLKRTPARCGNPPTASGRHNFQALCASKPFKDFFSSRRNTITLRRNGKKYVATR